ncbi:glycine betaine ABC transporter substrate-binding protein [Nocardia sp. BMG111209]|uniref:glycine betaine ABC transporter substrate-binding protein n=1 Tax=Nocardia sp. BMG111209 TaxID=1160137 RepID=UPI00037B5DA5|nr:glycine betaine ABC transporter substrate-binding protein [Nocardia sp. BMG111209]
MGSTGPVRIAARALVAAVAATLLVSCSHDDGGPVLRVGAGNSDQADLIAEIYAGALARTGARTAVVAHMGQRRDYLAALDAATVVLVGEVSGDLLTTFDPNSPAHLPDRTAAAGGAATNPAAAVDGPVGAAPAPDVADALSRALPQGLSVSDIADGTDLRPALLARATDDLPAALPDLAPRCADLTVGIATGSELDPLRPAPDPQRDVIDPLHTRYGCDITHPTVYPSDTELRKALQDGQVQLGILTGPAALLPGGTDGLTTIADPRYAFRARNVLPLFRTGSLTPVQIKKLNYVAGELTTAELIDMIAHLRDDHTSAATLARTWLDAHSL